MKKLQSVLWWGLCVFFCALGMLSHLMGMLTNFLFLYLLITSVLATIAFFWRIFFKTMQFDLVRSPFSDESRPYLIQFLCHSLLRLAACLIVYFSIIPDQIGAKNYSDTIQMLFSSTLVPVFFFLFPNRSVSRYRPLVFAGFGIYLFIELLFALFPVTPGFTELGSPFESSYLVFQGGGNPILNHHYPLISQRYALDLTSYPYRNPSHGLEKSGCFDQPILSPVNGKIVKSVDGEKDNAPGESNRKQILGNYLVIQSDEKFILLAHLKQGSQLVGEGDLVKHSQPIARCGNSGNSSEPHLHIQVQNFLQFNNPKLETYPISFPGLERSTRGPRSWVPSKLIQRNDVFTPAKPSIEGELE